MALLAAPLLRVLRWVSRGCNLQPPWPLCPSHQAPTLTDVSVALPWVTLARVAAGAQGTAKPIIKLKQLGNQQAGVSSWRGETKVKTKILLEGLI